jgi:hypothetical protein
LVVYVGWTIKTRKKVNHEDTPGELDEQADEELLQEDP